MRLDPWAHDAIPHTAAVSYAHCSPAAKTTERFSFLSFRYQVFGLMGVRRTVLAHADRAARRSAMSHPDQAVPISVAVDTAVLIFPACCYRDA